MTGLSLRVCVCVFVSLFVIFRASYVSVPVAVSACVVKYQCVHLCRAPARCRQWTQVWHSFVQYLLRVSVTALTVPGVSVLSSSGLRCGIA